MATETLSCSAHPDWSDPFPEPRTLPAGWYLAELPRYEPSPNFDRASVGTAGPNELAVELIQRRPDAFPEPKTFPSGWDLSDVLALERERLEKKNSEQEQRSFLLPISFDAAVYTTV
jgi:hypothetical protein